MRLWGMLSVFVLATCAGLFAAETSGPVRITFATMPPDWEVRGKPGCAAAVFAAGYQDGTNRVLRMTADKASATLKSGKLNVDLTRTPVMRWRWKAVTLPTGADGRQSVRDDQAIGLYVSTGGLFRQQSVAYRWETHTPTGTVGRAKYAGGVVSLYWIAVRDQTDLNAGPLGDWHIEQANVAEAFLKAFGTVPTSVGLGISCNSQYTGTRAEALLDWVEFLPAPLGTYAEKPAEQAPERDGLKPGVRRDVIVQGKQGG